MPDLTFLTCVRRVPPSHRYKYQDQPQIVVNPRTGKWACVLTVNSAHEGQGAQRVVSSTSTDEGKTWTPAAVVEPSPLSTGWINNLQSPDGLCFYSSPALLSCPPYTLIALLSISFLRLRPHIPSFYLLAIS